MAVTPYTFVIDISKKRLLESAGSLNSRDTPRFFRGDTAAFTVRLVEPSGSFDNPTPTKPFPAGASLLVAIGVPGVSADVLAAVAPATTSQDTRSGSLLVDTIDLRTLLGDALSKAATLEFRLLESDGTKTVLAQVECLVNNVVTLDNATPTEGSTTAGIAIQLCQVAASGANTATADAQTATTAANTATADAQTATTAANTATADANAAASNAATATQTATNGANAAATNANNAATNANNAANIQYGRSAYDLAVLNGFVGTEGAWLLSLKGLFVGSGGVVSVTTNRTLDASDDGKILVNFSTTPYTLTYRPNTLPAGFLCEVVQAGPAPLVLAAGSGATVLNSFSYTQTRTRGSPASLRTLSAVLAVSVGDLRA